MQNVIIAKFWSLQFRNMLFISDLFEASIKSQIRSSSNSSIIVYRHSRIAGLTVHLEHNKKQLWTLQVSHILNICAHRTGFSIFAYIELGFSIFAHKELGFFWKNKIHLKITFTGTFTLRGLQAKENLKRNWRHVGYLKGI